MKIRLLVLFLFSVVGGILLPSARGDEWSKETKFTFPEPLQIASVVLPAGTYWFKLIDDGNSSRFVFLVRTEDKKLVAKLIAIPIHRWAIEDDTTLKFWETPRGTPPALRSWFYPGDYCGYGFPYRGRISRR